MHVASQVLKATTRALASIAITMHAACEGLRTQCPGRAHAPQMCFGPVWHEFGPPLARRAVPT